MDPTYKRIVKTYEYLLGLRVKNQSSSEAALVATGFSLLKNISLFHMVIL
jgi:hypothetical protein